VTRKAVIACDKREAFAQGSESDEAIHSFFVPRDGLLRFARNDELSGVTKSIVVPAKRSASRDDDRVQLGRPVPSLRKHAT